MFNLGLEGGVEVYQRHNEELAGGGSLIQTKMTKQKQEGQ